MEVSGADRWMDGRTDGWTDRWMGLMDRYMNGQIYEWIHGGMDTQVDKRMSGWMDVDGEKDVQMDRQIDGTQLHLL